MYVGANFLCGSRRKYNSYQRERERERSETLPRRVFHGFTEKLKGLFFFIILKMQLPSKVQEAVETCEWLELWIVELFTRFQVTFSLLPFSSPEEIYVAEKHVDSNKKMLADIDGN